MRTSPISGLPYPDFFGPFLDDPAAAGLLWMTREGLIADQARAYRKANKVGPAAKDATTLGGTAVMVNVDFQTGFCMPPDATLAYLKKTLSGKGFDPEKMLAASGLGGSLLGAGGTLYVPGAVDDVFRASRFMLDNLPYINQIANSLDTHRVWQIFHPDMWRREDGSTPDPFTAIIYDNAKGSLVNAVTGERLSCLFNQAKAVRYCQKLAAKGSAPLTLWPYHVRVGSTHHPLMSLISEVQMFHEICRYAEADTEIKGYQQFTESYGIVGDEVAEIDGEVVGEEVRKPFIDLLLKHKVVIVAGEASSHCVRETVNQIKNQFAKRDPALVKRLHILKYATSPVPAIPGTETDPTSPLNFPAVADAAFTSWKAEGLHVHEDPNENWLRAALAA